MTERLRFARGSTPLASFDVAIIGGGPAGGAVAIALARRGMSVVLVEKTSYQEPRIGETLVPAARVPLAALGLWENFLRDEHAPSPANMAAWGSRELTENHFIFNPYGHGWHIDRARFDAMVASAAERAGACVWRGTRVKGWGSEQNGWRVCLETAGEIRARWLVDATGRAGMFARRTGARRVQADRLIGLVASIPNGAYPDNRTLVESFEGGWWYSASLPGERAIIALMTDRDLLPSTRAGVAEFWLEGLQQTRFTRERVGDSLGLSLRGAERRSNLSTRGSEIASPTLAARNDIVRIFSAQSYITHPTVGESWLGVGDAAYAFDPLSSQGIYRALESGLRAADAIMKNFCGDPNALEEYATWVQSRYEKFLVKRDWHYNQERRWTESMFWKRRHRNVTNDG